MTSNYNKLGQYIQPINIRNRDLEDLPLMGLSINKVFIPSIANTIGTNMANYKIIKRNQFAYGPVTSRNGDKITIALFEDYDKALISQAYIPFEVIDENILNPEYLMMWFRRTEFDRYARFKSHGSARETFDWEEMCEVELPVPSIEKQREIVKEYNTVGNRIKLNEQLNQKLEETAQTLYKHWFVDFEFPIDLCHLERSREVSLNETNAIDYSKGYKSSGGKMVYNEELDMEIPVGWINKTVQEEFNIQIGRTPPRHELDWFTKGGKGIKWISIKDLGENGSYILTTSEELTSEAINKFSIPIIPEGTTILSFKMSVGKIGIASEDMLSNEAIAHFVRKEKSFLTPEFIYCFLSSFNFNSLGTTSSIVNSINSKMVKELPLLIPSKVIIQNFEKLLKPIFVKKLSIEKQNIKLKNAKDLLLSKMTKVEVKKEMVN